ncbi:hypothetical protein [uncultured Desulfovibrio sp.]|uniref:hypothetical protein n=1 Tax=uncultured Desulfovibrio sp. TaxID=167968 RepID=UPI002609B30E|nr:hypothetical protein [uncultured Desulfovibrio sp.]
MVDQPSAWHNCFVSERREAVEATRMAAAPEHGHPFLLKGGSFRPLARILSEGNAGVGFPQDCAWDGTRLVLPDMPPASEKRNILFLR